MGESEGEKLRIQSTRVVTRAPGIEPIIGSTSSRTTAIARRRSGHGLVRRPVGAVVLGGDYVGLGVVRSLGRMGVPTCVVDDELSISRYSRYATTAVRVPRLRTDDDVLDALSVVSKHGTHGWVLFPTRDEIVAAISRHREALVNRFRVPTPGWETIRWAWDKRNTYRLAKELAVPIPQTIVLGEDGEIPAGLDYPVVVKPAIKEHFIYATKDKAWGADNEDELRSLLRAARAVIPASEVIVQERIPGDGSGQYAYCAFFRGGEAVGRMTVRRARQHPSDFGRASTFVETVEVPSLDEPSERFLRAIDYYGLVELEYKRDARDGIDKLLDVNARAWGYHSIGASAGVDFSRLLYLDQVGESVQRCRADAGVRWVRLATDLPLACVELVRGRLNLRDYARTLRRANVEAVFTADDWAPTLGEIMLLPYLAVKRGF